MTKAALITGVTGFIGSRLAASLTAAGWRTHGIVRPDSDLSVLPAGVDAHLYDGTVDNLIRAVKASQPDVVFHLASHYLAEHVPSQIGALVASNILFPAHLAEAMIAGGATRLVNTSTAWQHYRAATFDPVNLYAATKQAAEDLLQFYHDAHGLSVITLKLFDTFGVGDTRRKLVQLLVDAAQNGEPLIMSPGEQIVDLTHVDDVVDAFLAAGGLLCADGAARWERYFVSGDRMTVRALAARVALALDLPVDARFGGRPYRPREVMTPTDPGPSCPGWRPRRSLDVELRRLADASGRP